MQEDEYKVDMPGPGMDGGGGNSGSASGFSLDDILAEYGQEPGGPPQAEPEERGEPIIMTPAGRTVNAASFSSIDELIGQAEPPAVPEEIPQPEAEPEPGEEEAEPEAEEEPGEAEAPGGEENERTPPVYDGREYTIKNLVDSDEREKYASKDYPEPELTEEDEDAAEESAEREEKRQRREDARERFLSPVVAMLALIALRRGQRRKADGRSPTVEDEDESVPEMEPKRAARLYSGQARSLRLRAKMAAAVCAVMAYITFAWDSFLPLFGALGNSMRAASITLLIMQLTVMVIGLDVLTSGVMAAVRANPCFDSLVAAACVLSLLDAMVTASLNTEDYGLPFCAVSAAALAFSIWGSYLTCRGYKSSFRLLAKSDRLLPMAGTRVGDDSALLRYERGTHGFISRSEEADLSEYVYSTLAPLLFALALILGLLAGVHGHSKASLHCISALMSVSCAFSASICFALPFAVAARRMFRAGCAVAGWSGAREIGMSGSVVITDSDIFPPGTVEIENIRILEGAFNAKVIGYTGSVIAASGSGLAQSFSELIRKQGYPISRVEHFTPHDGGGMTAMVNGESVYVGSTGFMNLMGIRVPQKLSTKSTVFTAINGSLVGIFTMNYKPTAAVQRALASLLRSKCQPVFALRDFNITPVMIKKKFRMPTDKLEFPSYTERFALSAARPDERARPAAVSLRENIYSLAELSDVGRRLYAASRAGAAVSAAGSLVGLLVMFLLCWAGAFDSAGAANALLFMLLWLLPTLVISFGLQR